MSTTTESPPASPRNYNRRNVNMEKLIEEVKKRPPLWNKQSIKYNYKPLKMKLWDQVSAAVFQDEWHLYSDIEKKHKSLECQKKWRNVRDSYLKELAFQKKLLSGQVLRKKKRKYIYAESLSFLTADPVKKECLEIEISNDPLSDAQDGTDFDEERNYEEDRNNEDRSNEDMNDTNQTQTYTDFPFNSQKNCTEDRDNILKYVLANATKEKQYDEDISFSEMLVPMLKKLNDEQKHYAKLEILKVMNVARNYKDSSV